MVLRSKNKAPLGGSWAPLKAHMNCFIRKAAHKRQHEEKTVAVAKRCFFKEINQRLQKILFMSTSDGSQKQMFCVTGRRKIYFDRLKQHC